MLALISTLLSWVAGRLRSGEELELELIALRHQVAVLNRQRPSRLRLYGDGSDAAGLALPGVAPLPQGRVVTAARSPSQNGGARLPAMTEDLSFEDLVTKSS